MKARFVSLGCWLAGIVIVFALYSVALTTNHPWIIFAAVVLAALDARRIRVWRYESDIAQKPSVLFLLMLFLGWLILPWYIGLRLKILAGTARLNEDYRWLETQTTDYRPPTPPSGLIKPWSVRWRRRLWHSSIPKPQGR